MNIFLCIAFYLQNTSCSAPIMKRIISETEYPYTYHQYLREKEIEFMFLKTPGEILPEEVYGKFNWDGIPHVFGKMELKNVGRKVIEKAHFLICPLFLAGRDKGAYAWHFKTICKGKKGDKYFATDFIRPAFIWQKPIDPSGWGEPAYDPDENAQMQTFNTILDLIWNNIKPDGWVKRNFFKNDVKIMFYDDEEEKAFKSLEGQGKQVLFFKNNSHLVRKMIFDIKNVLYDNLDCRVTASKIAEVLPKYIKMIKSNEYFTVNASEFDSLKMKYAFINDIINIIRYAKDQNCRFEIYEAGDIQYPPVYDKAATYQIKLPTNDNFSDSDIVVQTNQNRPIDSHSQMKIGNILYICLTYSEERNMRNSYSIVIEGDINFYVTDLSFSHSFNWR